MLSATIYGFGVAGRELADHLLEHERFELRTVVDADPEITGERVSDLLDRTDDSDLVVTPPAEAEPTHVDVSLVLTPSHLDDVMPVVETCVEAGSNVVTTAEELFYPMPAHASEFDRLNELAHEHGVSVLSTGMNPGFIMDLLPATVSGLCVDVDHLYMRRHVNAAPYHTGPSRSGFGLEPAAYRERFAAGNINRGHVGLEQSLRYLEDALGFESDDVSELYEPIIAEATREAVHMTVPEGTVTGVHQRLFASVDGVVYVTLDLVMEVFAADADPMGIGEIRIEGTPPMRLQTVPSIPSLESTVGHVINSAPAVVEADPGYRTLLDLPPVAAMQG